MDAEQRNSPLLAKDLRPTGLSAWWTRWRLRAVCREIDRIERDLAAEHGLTVTLPMHRELQALIRQREVLQGRLAD